MLDVKDDITALESVNLCVLMVQGVATSLLCYDWVAFIKEKKIERHFKITEKKSLPLTLTASAPEPAHLGRPLPEQ